VEDAEDAFQRAMEIVITKAPTTDPLELIRWTQTVTKHEALAVRRGREQATTRFARPAPGGDEAVDWTALIPAEEDGPDERVEQRESVARVREALRTLKPAERRALGLLASGCSYAEIGQMTGFSASKVNRCIAEGRERLRCLLARSESGERCVELRPLLSAFCDGEASEEEASLLLEHLRACGSCRAALRAYRAAPGAVAALLPAPFGLAALLDRAREIVGGLQAYLPGKGAGGAMLAKAGVACVGTAGVAFVAVGALPAQRQSEMPAGKSLPAVERQVEGVARTSAVDARDGLERKRRRAPRRREVAKEGRGALSSSVDSAPIEYAPPPEAAPEPAPVAEPAPTPAPATPPSGSVAGEFGP
jgi:RNA polymerase sigma factor (sigma-70 family)